MNNIQLPPPGAEMPMAAGATMIVADFAAHAVMVNTEDPHEPAVPAVQLQLEGTMAGLADSPRFHTRVLLELAGAIQLRDGITKSIELLNNLRNNQEGQ